MRETIAHLLHYLRIDLRKITEIFVDYTGSKEMLKPSEQCIQNAVFDTFYHLILEKMYDLTFVIIEKVCNFLVFIIEKVYLCNRNI